MVKQAQNYHRGTPEFKMTRDWKTRKMAIDHAEWFVALLIKPIFSFFNVESNTIKASSLLF